ncbi:MAG: excinuclease ABC subunit UvrB [Proteobacteria bacterium]|nr:excinuclease ABC subunit UvrB [Pseudomonadota bacterium]
MRMKFKINSEFSPCGDQPEAIDRLVDGLENGRRAQTLLGITGSGKTFTIASVIERVQRPTLIIAPNKTLAGQLFTEFKALFPQNAVEYFVSYYDYYQPEAYIPASGLFIEKDAKINDDIERMRLSATHSLLTRNDVIIVASVSCIYGLGTADSYLSMRAQIQVGEIISRDAYLRKLTRIQYERNQYDLDRATFRVRGDTVEVFPAYESDRAYRISFFGDEVESIQEIDPVRGAVEAEVDKLVIFPASHYVVTDEMRQKALMSIKAELNEVIEKFRREGKLVECQRIEERTNEDIANIAALGYCSGIENYSRHLTGRAPGEAPPCLINYFPDDFLLVIDESHVSVPQIGGMYRGDRSRKQVLVDYGFRLPSALDNRPLNFEEFEALIRQVIYVSATPGDREIEESEGEIVEQLIRPTGLLDPLLDIRPALGQVDDAVNEIKPVVDGGARVLVTTLTKRMAEDLTEYLNDTGVRARYLHSDIDTLERAALLRDLRLGQFDVLVGINLLREGLDLPEVQLVCILDADKEGFLRSRRSLIQTIGRASRNANGRVILYADTMTDSLHEAIDETRRRRAVQEAFNEAHGITPKTIIKNIQDLEAHIPDKRPDEDKQTDETVAAKDIPARIEELTQQMKDAAKQLDFETAALLRDRITVLRRKLERK